MAAEYTFDSESRLRRHIEILAGDIGERNIWRYEQLERAAGYIETEFRKTGCRPKRQEYTASGRHFANICVEIPGTGFPERIVVIGAHYDTSRGSPGANGNASGVAVLLELARAFADRPQSRTLRLVAFTNEERPFLRTERMGSRVYARHCRQRGESIDGMVSLESIGSCSSHQGSQSLSMFGLLLPKRGDFVALVGNRASEAFLREAASAFRRGAVVPSYAYSLPGVLPGASNSDHWSFWQEGYPAIMVTDTAPLRYRRYHRPTDAPDQVNYPFLAQVTTNLESFAVELTGDPAAEPQGASWQRQVTNAALAVAGGMSLAALARTAARRPRNDR